MPKLILIILLNSIIIITGGGPAYAQKPPQNIQQDTAAEKTATQPEVQKQIVNIALKDDRLSVDLVNANFGETIRSIAQKAGFSIEGNSSVFRQKMTTKFNDLEVDIGIIRLFSIVKESNYLINYDTKGSISILKVYETGELDSIHPTSSPTKETGAFPFKTWRSRRLRNSEKPEVPVPTPPAPQVSQPDTLESHPDTLESHPDTPESHPDTPESHPDTPESHPDTLESHPDTLESHPDTPESHSDTPESQPETPDQEEKDSSEEE